MRRYDEFSQFKCGVRFPCNTCICVSASTSTIDISRLGKPKGTRTYRHPLQHHISSRCSIDTRTFFQTAHKILFNVNNKQINKQNNHQTWYLISHPQQLKTPPKPSKILSNIDLKISPPSRPLKTRGPTPPHVLSPLSQMLLFLLTLFITSCCNYLVLLLAPTIVPPVAPHHQTGV
ncbi:hypothetical protein GGI42DRAFT_13587 [Trichoderma sp. SZMC 28013]